MVLNLKAGIRMSVGKMIYLALTLIPTKLGNMSGLLLLSDTHLEQICV